MSRILPLSDYWNAVQKEHKFRGNRDQVKWEQKQKESHERLMPTLPPSMRRDFHTQPQSQVVRIAVSHPKNCILWAENCWFPPSYIESFISTYSYSPTRKGGQFSQNPYFPPRTTTSDMTPPLPFSETL